MIPGDLDNPANDYSHGIFGLQIGMSRREPGSAAPSAGALARAHAERINAIQKYFVEKTRLIGLPELRTHPELARMRVLQRGNRLSITAVDPAEWSFIAKLAKRKP